MTTPQYQCQSWYDGESKSVKDCTCGKCADAIKRPMNTKQIIQNMEKEFDERFPGDVVVMEEDGSHARVTSSLYNRDSIKSFIHSYTRSLLSAFAEELIGKNYKVKDKDRDEDYFLMGRNALREEQHLKAKEIISSIEK